MSESKTPLIGPGRIQWNSGGWLGASIGGTAWMLVTAGFLAVYGQLALACVPAVCCGLVLLTALLLWVRRDRVRPCPAIMALLGVLAVTYPTVWLAVRFYGSDSALAAMNWQMSSWAAAIVCAIAPVMMLWMWIFDGMVSTDASPSSGERGPT